MTRRWWLATSTAWLVLFIAGLLVGRHADAVAALLAHLGVDQ